MYFYFKYFLALLVNSRCWILKYGDGDIFLSLVKLFFFGLWGDSRDDSVVKVKGAGH